jgi:hypothetical protein
LMAAGVIQAIADQVAHALLAHVGEVHWRAGWVLRRHPRRTLLRRL